MNTLDYFLKANLYGLLFVGSYWLLLRRHTFFGLNRLYLLASAILSLALPFASLPTQAVETLPRLDWPMPTPVGIITLPTAIVAVSAPELAPVAASPDWEQIGLIAYGLITLGLVIRFFVRTTRLLQLIRQSPHQTHERYVLVQPNNPAIPTFSFFRYVILNPADAQNELIIQHELVHVRQYHSADVMSMSLLQAVFWACPTLWLMDRLLRQVHEFLADKPTRKPTEYARFLVDYSFGIQPGLNGPDTLTNSFFNPSLLKQCIIMLHRRATTRWALGKYALVLPLVFSLLAMTTVREDIAAIVSQNPNETITVSGRVTSVDGHPLEGVAIMDGKRLFKTDQKGYYRLTDLPNPSTLMFSHTAFKAVTHKITRPAKLNITLQSISEELPAMGATSVYKSIKPNPNMPVRTPPSSETINGNVYTAVEEPAVFPTGVPGLMQYVAHELRYPARAKAAKREGVVLVQFIVMPNGSVGAAMIKKGFDSECNVEALRVVKKMPPWLPGKQNGKSVATEYVIPIQFALEKKEDNRTEKLIRKHFTPPVVRLANFQPCGTQIIRISHGLP